MLLTITTTHRPATDLGYLLHKNPARPQFEDLPFGRNDRPYVASSFLSVAMTRCFRNAIAGTSKDRPDLVDVGIPLEATLACLPCRGGEDLLRRLFAPLGYEVVATREPLDPRSRNGARVPTSASRSARPPGYATCSRTSTSWCRCSTRSIDEAVRWWEELTGRGGEGMVVKPLAFVARGSRGLLQPAIKCRGPEYLRIIYGPEYTAPENLERLRARGLSAKRSLALREFALGIEGLERFVRREPLRRVHECAFGVLALESEPVDPRL